ncbi:MAG: hypothetical protein MJ079_05950 [Ruminococcus sp.]|nr:hypothetical protein [Ruminococcus sp.]
MNKATRTIHIVVSVLVWLTVIINAAWFAVEYHTFPEQIGCHFGPDGEFDVIAERFYGFYPYVVCLVICGLCEIAGLVTGKLRLGLKITERADSVIREGFRFFLDVLKICIACFYGCVWSECVIHQHALNVKIGAAFAIVFIILIPSFLLFVIAAAVVGKIRYKKQNKS